MGPSKDGLERREADGSHSEVLVQESADAGGVYTEGIREDGGEGVRGKLL